ncbi:hypothetical protein BaRGS_00015726 [Batillaria attramentaria]|uniref:Secreted protein n=1 Tax=Batillaria attramentaria TaxID=370345 RepID=A0ABD0L174_9CAEN
MVVLLLSLVAYNCKSEEEENTKASQNGREPQCTYTPSYTKLKSYQLTNATGRMTQRANVILRTRDNRVIVHPIRMTCCAHVCIELQCTQRR